MSASPGLEVISPETPSDASRGTGERSVPDRPPGAGGVDLSHRQIMTIISGR